MTKLDWTLLDDEDFCYLVSDLLEANGYRVNYQGDGPDGGIDLFAIQTISFAFDAQAYTWAVQCKFSKNTTRSINDSEVHDIEGIVHSSRYKILNPMGYMIITNRRISQNVIERLRGINSNGSIKTCAIDGKRLVSMLDDKLKLVHKHFVRESMETALSESGDRLINNARSAINKIFDAYRSNMIYFPELMYLGRYLSSANREIETEMLREQAKRIAGSYDEDIDVSVRMRGSMAKEQLEGTGESLDRKIRNI